MRIPIPFFLIVLLFACSKSPVKKDDLSPVEPPEPPVVIPPSVPQLRSSVQVDFSATNTVEIARPEGAAAGDLLIAIMAKDGNTSSKPSTEEGWVRIVSKSYGSGVPLIRAWWKKVAPSDGTHYSFSPGGTSQTGRLDLICIKNWNGSAPTAIAEMVTGTAEFTTPGIPAISPDGKDLLLTAVAVAAASGLENVSWQNKTGFTALTGKSVSKVTLATSYKSGLAESGTALVKGNTFSTMLPSARRAALLSFIVPANSKRPVIRIYRGGASRTIGAGGVELYETNQALVNVLSDASLGYDVRSTGEKEVDKITADMLSNADLYIQPGGPTIQVGWPYVQGQKEIIRNYLDDGGKYLGVCLGAYFLRNYYSGQSFDLLPEGNFAYTYSSLDGSPYVSGTDTAKVNLYDNWGDTQRHLTISGASYFHCPLPIPDLATLARYVYPENIKPRAAIRYSYNPNNDSKKGWIIGIGPHPEADDTWRTMEDPDGLDHDLILTSVKDLLGR